MTKRAIILALSAAATFFPALSQAHAADDEPQANAPAATFTISDTTAPESADRDTAIEHRLRQAAVQQAERLRQQLKETVGQIVQPPDGEVGPDPRVAIEAAKTSPDTSETVDSLPELMLELAGPLDGIDAATPPLDHPSDNENDGPATNTAEKPQAVSPLRLELPLAESEPVDSSQVDELTAAEDESGPEAAETVPVERQEKTGDTTSNEADPYKDPWHVPIESLTSAQKARRARIRNVLGFYYNRQLDTVQDSPWSMMHHMIAWGSDSLIWTGSPGNSKRVSCIGWLCANGVCEGERLLVLKNGKIYPRVGPGLQGHECQFLAMLAQARVPAKQPIRVADEMFTVHDLIEQEQLACRPKTELTFRLIGLIHYLDTDTTWESSDGQSWDFPRLIREEIAQPINGTTCGGTHRLMGMSYAVRRRLQEGLPVDGQWDRADRYTADYRNYAYRMSNRDGSFSSDFWRSRGTWGDIDRKLKTTGHVLEWMVFSSPHDELENPKLVRSVDYLTSLLAQNRYYDWGKGALGHAVRALSLYDERVFGGVPGERDLRLASRPPRIVPKEKQAEQQQATKKNGLRRALMFRRPTR